MQCLCVPSDDPVLIKALVAGTWAGSSSGKGSGGISQAKVQAITSAEATVRVPRVGVVVMLAGVGVLSLTQRGLGSWACMLMNVVVDEVAKEVEASVCANTGVGVVVMASV
jgi:hypothetical protein